MAMSFRTAKAYKIPQKTQPLSMFFWSRIVIARTGDLPVMNRESGNIVIVDFWRKSYFD
jgi:hypothetical protein